MIKSANLGFPRIGARRELKKANENYWRGQLSAEDLQDFARQLRARHRKLQRDAGLDIIPSNDFSLYDQVLDMTATVGAIPERYEHPADMPVSLDIYFAMARGTAHVPAMEMTKWFDTNYHYIVPEFSPDQSFQLSAHFAIEAFEEALALGIETRPVLIGPVTFLSLGKMRESDVSPLILLDDLLLVYRDLLLALKDAGATMVQFDEPVLALDLTPTHREAFQQAYRFLASLGVDLTLATYFGGLGDNLALATELPLSCLHIDLIRAPGQLNPVLDALSEDTRLSLGLIDGRNIWRSDLSAAITVAETALNRVGRDRLEIAPSCSLLHAPVDLELETTLDPELKSWLAFATQKLSEVVAVSTALNAGRPAIADKFADSDRAQDSRKQSPRIHNTAVKDRVAGISSADLNRMSAYEHRARIQRKAFDLPLFPTTTIGSFPQTKDVRKVRASFKRGDIDQRAYHDFLRKHTEDTIRRQEALDIDVLVHGEFERNDMVEYFGEKLEGFAFTKNGWVQSYGSRCVKPPIIFGDVSRPDPMTVNWSVYAQTLTNRPVKGMLTGPVTILQWSFVRDDQPRADTCWQLALAIRDEVIDLESAGIGMIQIDEPALREGLPLRKSDWPSYLTWAVDCFRLSASGVADETQIHTHMCYSEFSDIMPSIAALDADVISIETSRSQMELLDDFKVFEYPNEIGPGIWDIHSPRVPSAEEMVALLERAADVIPRDRLWVNPDCGLKTRDWREVEASLSNMIHAAKAMRSIIAEPPKRALANTREDG